MPEPPSKHLMTCPDCGQGYDEGHCPQCGADPPRLHPAILAWQERKERARASFPGVNAQECYDHAEALAVALKAAEAALREIADGGPKGFGTAEELRQIARDALERR